MRELLRLSQVRQYRLPHKERPRRDYNLAANRKIGRGRALQLLRQGEDNTATCKEEKYLEIAVEKEARKKICPFRMEKCLKTKYNINREDINTNTKEYVVKVWSAQQLNKLLSAKSEVPCAVTMHGSFTESRGLLYMHEYDVTDVESFKAGLAARYDIKEVVPSRWVTPKSSYSNHFS